MARSKYTKALEERRKQEREREHQEELRQQALERRQEEERDQAREEERRQEALQQTKEFEDALEAAQQKREAFLSQLRSQKQAERKHAERQNQHRSILLNILREANRQETKAEEKAAEKQTAQQQETRQARLDQQQQADKATQQATIHRDEVRQERLVGQQAASKAAERQADNTTQRQQETRQERLGEQRQADKTAQRQLEGRQQRQQEQQESDKVALRQQEIRQERLNEQLEADKTAGKKAEQQQTARQEHLQEQKQTDQQAEKVAQRQEAARQERLDQQRQTDKAAERQEAARQEQREADQVARRKAGQQEATRQEQLAAQREEAKAAQRQTARQAVAQSERQAANRARQTETPTRNPLEDPLSSGLLSGSLPWLRVNGNLVTTLNGDPVLLRGVNLLGFDSAAPDAEAGFTVGAGFSDETFGAIQSWGANVIRVAINRSRVIGGLGDWSAADYLSDLDGIVSQAAAGGMYTLLSLRRLDEATVFGTLPGVQGSVPNYIAPQPDADTVGMWRVLGERYANEAAVLFDLYTSPHAALPNDLTGFYTNWELWKLWVRLMVADLRQGHPRALCFVSGLDWGTDLSGFPVIGTDAEPMGDLVYTAHIYPQRPISLPALQTLARKHPLFVTEWGGEANNLGWGERVARVLRSAGVGWTAANWNAAPTLVQSRGQRLLPSRFGGLVYRELALEGLPPQLRTNIRELLNSKT